MLSANPSTSASPSSCRPTTRPPRSAEPSSTCSRPSTRATSSLIVVDDGSVDGTAEPAARRAGPAPARAPAPAQHGEGRRGAHRHQRRHRHPPAAVRRRHGVLGARREAAARAGHRRAQRGRLRHSVVRLQHRVPVVPLQARQPGDDLRGEPALRRGDQRPAHLPQAWCR
nr:hypothetical protein [Angustibacter aerolatus]